MKKFLNNVFHWDFGTATFAIAFFLTLMVFNVVWCSWTTFTPFSHFPLYISTILLTMLLTLPYVLFHRKWIEIVLLVLLDCLLLANVMYSRTYFAAIPLSSYSNASNLNDFMPSVWASLKWIDLVFPIITIVTAIIVYRNKSEKQTSRLGFLALTAIPVIITLINFPSLNKFKEHYRTYYNNAYAYQSTPVMYSVAGSLLYDALVANEKLSPEQERETMDFLHSLPGVPALSDSVNAPKSLVIVLCESLESWVIGMDYNGAEVTPNLTRWSREATSFYDPHVLSQARDGRSIDGQLLTLTGILPLTSGTYATQFPDNTYPSIIWAMKQLKGSRATLMTGDKEYTWNQGRIARRMGQDSIVSFKDFRVEESYTGRRHIGDRALMNQVVEKLKKGDIMPVGSSSFLQIVTYSGHGPFRLPDKEKKIPMLEGTPQIMYDYLNTAHYTDEALGLLVDYLSSRPDWKNTMVVITGDHEGLATWRDEVIKNPIGSKYVSSNRYVPLLILNSPIPGDSDKEIGQVDIYTTLLHLMGLGNYSWYGVGKSALDSRVDTAANTNLNAQIVSDRILRYNLLK